MATELPTIPRILLIDTGGDVSDARACARSAKFATGVGPTKSLIAKPPARPRESRARPRHDRDVAWTFRASEKTSYPNVRAEMQHFLYDLGIDALFTNDPDQFPRQVNGVRDSI